MTKADLIKLLENYPDTTEFVCEEERVNGYVLCNCSLRQYSHLPGVVGIVPGDRIIMSSL